jgi:hypothetical protein
MRIARITAVAGLLAILPATAWAQQTLTFEGFASGTELTTQYAGINFQGATILTEGISLNPPFPPRSGVNVVYNPVGPMELIFSSAISFFQGYFTYNSGLTLQGFDSFNALVATSIGAYDQNFIGSGNPDNELVRIDAAGITRVLITGGGGNNFVMDDAQFTGSINIVPEPGTVFLVASGLVGVLFTRRRRSV